MGLLRVASLVLAFLAATGLVLGSFGFSAMSADRGLNAEVVDDDDAYLGYETLHGGDSAELVDGESVELVEYHNRFGVDLTEFNVDVSAEAIADGDPSATVTGAPEDLGIGDDGTVAVEVHFEGAEEVELTFQADADGESVAVDKERTVTVEREFTAEEFTIEFAGEGAGNVEKISGPEAAFPLEVAVESEQGNSMEVTHVTVNSSGDDLKDERDDIDGNIVAVELVEYDVREEP